MSNNYYTYALFDRDKLLNHIEKGQNILENMKQEMFLKYCEFCINKTHDSFSYKFNVWLSEKIPYFQKFIPSEDQILDYAKKTFGSWEYKFCIIDGQYCFDFCMFYQKKSAYFKTMKRFIEQCDDSKIKLSINDFNELHL